MTVSTKFDNEYRSAPRPAEALAASYAGSAAPLLAALPAVITQLQNDIAAWAGNPTTAQAALAVTDIRSIAVVVERIHGATHKARAGA